MPPNPWVALHLQHWLPMAQNPSSIQEPPPSDHLARNLSRFRRLFPELAEAIEAADSSETQRVEGPSGERSLSFRGTLLASAYDPMADGNRLAEQIPEGADVVVALGFGTGHQLEALQARGVRRLLVYEPHLGLLKGALEARPLPVLDSPDVRLTADEQSMVEELAGWYAAGSSLHVLAHPSLGRIAPEKLRAAVARIARAKETADVRCATLRTWARHWALTSVDNAGRLAECARIGRLRGAFPDAPAVVCAAGPSLGKQLCLVREHRDQLLVIAIGQSLAALEHAGVRPDLVLVTETQDVTHQLEGVSNLHEQNLVLVPQSNPRLFDLPVGRRFAGFEASNPFAVWLGEAFGETEWLRSGGTVAASAVFLAAFLGATKVMLIGQDLAFTSGRRYAEGSPYEDLGVTQEEDGSLYFTNLKVKADFFNRPTPDRELAPATLRVEGWYGEDVWTDRSYASFREEYRAIGKILAEEDVRLINCTEGGARIPGLEHEAFRTSVQKSVGAALHVNERLAALEIATFVPGGSGLSSAGQALSQAARRLQVEAARAGDKLARFENAQRTAGAESLLRAAAIAERKVRNGVARLPVVEFLIQNELHELQIASQKGDGSRSGAVARSKALLEAVARGTEGVIELMGRLTG